MRNRLLAAARRISANRNEPSVSSFVALRKLFIQERRDWSRPGAPRIGWKRGELIEIIQAIGAGDWQSARDEWGDVGYYVAQVGWLAWALYRIVTPATIIERACQKFEQRAMKGIIK